MTYRIVIWNPCDSHFDGGRFILRGQHGQKQRWQLSQSWLPDIPRPPDNNVFQQVKPLCLYLLKIDLINHKHTHFYDNIYIYIIPPEEKNHPKPKKACNMQQIGIIDISSDHLIYHIFFYQVPLGIPCGSTWNRGYEGDFAGGWYQPTGGRIDLCSLESTFVSVFSLLWWHLGMDQYLLIPFLVGWASIYQLFWCSPGVQGFDTLPFGF